MPGSLNSVDERASRAASIDYGGVTEFRTILAMPFCSGCTSHQLNQVPAGAFSCLDSQCTYTTVVERIQLLFSVY